MSTPAKKTVQPKMEIHNYSQPLRPLTATLGEIASFPDTESELIDELSGLIRKWKSRPGKQCIDISDAYKAMLNQLLTPDTE